jgi:hypothetical protein
MAFVSVALVLALFTPLADPARLSVSDQVRRLETGKVKPEAFDYRFMRFESGRYGREALAKLKTSKTGEIAKRAAAAAAQTDRYPQTPAPTQVIAPRDNVGLLRKVEVFPRGQSLPKSFVDQFSRPDAAFACNDKLACLALIKDVDGRDGAEVIISNPAVLAVYRRAADGRWEEYGRFTPRCAIGLRDAFAKGDVTPRPSKLPDLIVAGKSYGLTSESEPCPDEAVADR